MCLDHAVVPRALPTMQVHARQPGKKLQSVPSSQCMHECVKVADAPTSINVIKSLKFYFLELISNAFYIQDLFADAEGLRLNETQCGHQHFDKSDLIRSKFDHNCKAVLHCGPALRILSQVRGQCRSDTRFAAQRHGALSAADRCKRMPSPMLRQNLCACSTSQAAVSRETARCFHSINSSFGPHWLE